MINKLKKWKQKRVQHGFSNQNPIEFQRTVKFPNTNDVSYYN